MELRTSAKMLNTVSHKALAAAFSKGFQRRQLHLYDGGSLSAVKAATSKWVGIVVEWRWESLQCSQTIMDTKEGWARL